MSFHFQLRVEACLQFETDAFPLRRVLKVNPRRRSQVLGIEELLIPLFQERKNNLKKFTRAFLLILCSYMIHLSSNLKNNAYLLQNN